MLMMDDEQRCSRRKTLNFNRLVCSVCESAQYKNRCFKSWLNEVKISNRTRQNAVSTNCYGDGHMNVL